MEYTIINVKDFSSGLNRAVEYIHNKWGNKNNYPFYYDEISNSSGDANRLPKFFLMLRQSEIIGCYALLVNDLISRQDLLPWFACLFIEEHCRGQRLSNKMFAHAKNEILKMGYSQVYLTTDHDGFYEKFGWTRIEDGYNFLGTKSRIYKISAA